MSTEPTGEKLRHGAVGAWDLVFFVAHVVERFAHVRGVVARDVVRPLGTAPVAFDRDDRDAEILEHVDA